MDKLLDNVDYLFLNYSMDFRFDLQLFAAEDEGRTEEPTEYKKRRAREEGKVIKTPELPSALVLLFGFFFIYLFSKTMFRNSMQMMEYYFGLIPSVARSGENVVFLMKPVGQFGQDFSVPLPFAVF